MIMYDNEWVNDDIECIIVTIDDDDDVYVIIKSIIEGGDVVH